jgi:AraC-like DNA-binding protein
MGRYRGQTPMLSWHTDLALAMGFSSSQYLATVFRRYTGESPSVSVRAQKWRETTGGAGFPTPFCIAAAATDE